MKAQLRAGLAALCFLCFCAPGAKAQPVAFDVPEQVTFAGQKLRLSPEAQEVVRKHGQALIRNAKFYRAMTERADAYFPLVERVFREEGLPDDFKYLVIQESGLASDVISTSNAVGYWQFKAATATGLGLRVDSDIDERMHIMASSRGAARYLVKNNQYLNNWTFALISYYAGLTGSKSVANPPLEVGASELSLDGESHFYILKFLAHKIAFEQAVNRSPNPALQVMEYTECEGKTLRQIASETNVDPAQIEFYNKWCRTGVVPQDRDYSVIIPVTAGQAPSWMAMTTRPTAPALGENLKPWKEKVFFGLIEKEPASVDPSLNKSAPIFFSWNGIKAILARKQDNINRLALAAGVSKEDLMDYNDLRVFDLIVPGQTYYVHPKRKKAKVPFHTVRQGETIWEVAQSYGVTLQAVMRKNRMNSPEKLVAGRILWLRHTRPEDHPIEYDKSVPNTPVVPVTRPISQSAQPVYASISEPSAVITSAPRSKDPDAPTLAQLAEKYEGVKANEQTEQVAEPIFISDETPTAPKDEVEASGGERVPSPSASKVAAAPATKPMAKPASATPKPVPSSPSTLLASSPAKTHTVQPKETLYGISRQYNVAAAELIAANPTLEAGLKVGAVLQIPAPAKAPAPVATPAAKPAATVATYTVQPGDTFYSISKKFGLTVEQLKSLNAMSETGLSLGQVLKVK